MFYSNEILKIVLSYLYMYDGFLRKVAYTCPLLGQNFMLQSSLVL